MSDTATREIDGIQLPAAGPWQIDQAHSQVEFSVRHLGLSKVRGRFGVFEGVIEVAERPEDTKVQVSIDVTSVDTREANRDEHLKSPDFFDATQFPKMEFKSTSITKKGDDYEMAGDLTLHGVTKPVALATSFEGVGGDPWGNTRAAFEATTEIDRTDFGLTWNQALETGSLVVGKKVAIRIEVEAVRPA